MAVEILMPKLGLTMKTGTVVKWLKEEGDAVHAHEPALEIETEKLSYQIESPAEGVLLKRIAIEGEKYPIAFVVGYVGRADFRFVNCGLRSCCFSFEKGGGAGHHNLRFEFRHPHLHFSPRQKAGSRSRIRL